MTLTPRERFLAAVRNEVPNRIPVTPDRPLTAAASSFPPVTNVPAIHQKRTSSP